MALFDASVDLNPHQIEAALFAIRTPLSKGVVLADEVGLGKTIEAGLVLCQYWAERKRKLLVITPASLRKQWSLELAEKFHLPSIILDSKSYRKIYRDGEPEPFKSDKVIITSLNFASRMRTEIRAIPFDLVVIDEAHKLRNAYRPSNVMGQNIKWAIEDRKKCLLTATPLQNSLLELFGLSIILDDRIFGDVTAFRTQYTNAGADLQDLRRRLQSFCHRTLRRQVVEYIQYTKRQTFTAEFTPTNDEQQLYESVSEFLSRDDTFSIPKQHRQLTSLILQKLLASSSHAIAHTLDTMCERLELIRDNLDLVDPSDDFIQLLIEEEELEEDYLDEMEGEPTQEEASSIDLNKLNQEIDELRTFAQWARNIQIDTKSKSLIQALEKGFQEMEKMGANRKALIFTESRRTQDYLKRFLESNGYAGQLVLFNGSNSDPDSRQIINHWLGANANTGRVTGSRPIDSRTALIEHFRDHATVMIATEAAAEGVNLQFCSMVLNYDLPWNPQRIEQRIGRCHRYGQKHDVVVINFLNKRNEADKRVLELLTEKFNLFDGIFGSSDEVLGQIETGVDFERQILTIYQQCRSLKEIEFAFQQLQQKMDESIQLRMDQTRQQLLEHFDEDVHARLKIRLNEAEANLDRFGRMFWTLTKVTLNEIASFCDDSYSFELQQSPIADVQPGQYHLISRKQQGISNDFLYRLTHPLGEWTIDQSKQTETPLAKVTFDVTGYAAKISVIEALKGKSGWLLLQMLQIESFDHEEYLLFSALDESGNSLDPETCQKLFQCSGVVSDYENMPEAISERLDKEANRHAEATIAKSLELNNELFNEERERLEKWSDDMILAAEKELSDTKTQLKAIRRQSQTATTLDEQSQLQEKLQKLEKQQRKQRQQIFAIEDEIADKREKLIKGLQRRMAQKTERTHLFTIQWEVV